MTAISQAIELSGLTKDKSAVLTSKFGSMVELITDWKQKAEALIITDESQTVEIATAKEGYKFIKGVRVDIEKTRKVLKEDSLKEGRAIDLIAKSLTEEVSPLELELEKKAKFVEIQEEKRKTARTQERLERASAFGFAVPQVAMIIEMSDEMFDVFLSGLKADAEKREAEIQAAEKLRIEAEQKAEAEKLKAERAERVEKVEKERIEAQRIENEKLKIEAEKREAEIAEERKQAEAERVKQEAIQAENARIQAEQLRAEKERNEKIQAEIRAIQAKIQAEKDEESRLEKERFWKIQAKKDEQIKAEKEKTEALQAEIKAKAEQEEAERLHIVLKEKEALNAPDKEKLKIYLQQILDVRVPVLNTNESKNLFVKMANEMEALVERLRLEIDLP